MKHDLVVRGGRLADGELPVSWKMAGIRARSRARFCEAIESPPEERSERVLTSLEIGKREFERRTGGARGRTFTGCSSPEIAQWLANRIQPVPEACSGGVDRRSPGSASVFWDGHRPVTMGSARTERAR